MQQKLDSILSDPDMMQKIMSLAQSLGQPQQEIIEKPKPQIPAIDPAMMQRIAGMMQQSGIDRNQQTLLNALCPYLSRERISKLERAMRAAKLAGVATTMLGSGLLTTGR
jgi:hypothetical protein